MNDKIGNKAFVKGSEIDLKWIWATLGLISIIVFFPLLDTGFTTTDDMATALKAWNYEDFLGFPLEFAKQQGRFNQAINTYIDWIPYIFKSNVAYQTIRLSAIVLTIILFFIVVKIFSGSVIFACVITLLILSFLQNNWQHNLLTSYPLVFHFGFSMLLISFYAFYQFKVTGKVLWAFIYGLCYLFSMFVSELFVLYSIIFFSFSIGFEWGSERKKIITRVVRLSLPAFLSALFFLGTWFVFNAYYPGKYSGVQLADFSLTGIIRVIVQLSAGTIPGAFYLTGSGVIHKTFDGFSNHYIGLASLLTQFKIQWLVKGILASGGCWYLLQKKSDIKISRTWIFRMLFIGILSIILPFVLLGLTAKYQRWIGLGTLAYMQSYFSYFGTILTLSSILLFINDAVKNKKFIKPIFMLTVCSIVFFTSGITDYYNHYVTLDQQISQLKWATVEKFIKTPEIGNIPEGSVIYAPSLFHNTRGILKPNTNYWTKYFTLKTKKKIIVIENLKKKWLLDRTNTHYYYLRFLQEPKSKNQFILFAKLKRLNDLSANAAYLFSYSKYKTYTMMGILKPNGQPIKIHINNNPVNSKNIGEKFFCHQVKLVSGRIVKKEKLSGKSFFELIKIALGRIGNSETVKDEASSGLYKTFIKSNVPLKLEGLTISFFPIQLRFD